ncbi:CHAT domain-containing protein [Spirosoma validum]|uniref:CHAT domain-containing protein n=1 Tax=Spirosoma validum TaxID=2771355 RepID=A0A927B509_9BACT|nr:CHAT domain-containing protein [Spirosoma validum]MBD2755322.1 CHAT domain-containing protein [Spirosoma validum]
MRYYLFHKCFIAWIALFGLSYHAIAQCPARTQLQTRLQRLSDAADITKTAKIDAAQVQAQVTVLQKWQRQWQQCGYPLDSTYINGLLQLGLVHYYRGELPEATQTVRQAIRLCQTARAERSVDQPAKAYYRLGMLLVHQNQPAVETLKQAVRLGQGIRSADRWMGGACLYLANAYYSAGDYQQALSIAKQGEQVASHTTDWPLIAKLLLEKAETLNVLEQYSSARQAAERAIAMSERGDYQSIMARAYRQVGIIAENQEQFIDALRYRQRAFEIARTINDPTAPDYAVSVGNLYYRLGQYDRAVVYFQYGVDNNTNSYAKANSLDKLGEVYQKKKAYDRALRYYQQGLTTIPIHFGNPAITGLPNAQTIQLADQKEYLLRIIQNKADTWLDYAKATTNQQRLHYALETYKVADRMIDFMRWEHIGQQSKLFWRYKTRSIYERAIETSFLLKNTEQAFHFFEKSRAAMLGDKLNELGARQQLSPEQTEEEERLRQNVSKRQMDFAAIIASQPINDAAYRKAQSALNSEQDELDQFRKKLEKSNPVYYQVKYDTAATSLFDLRQHLKRQNASFVSYFVGDSTLYVLGVTADTSVLYRQPLRSYGQNVNAFMNLLWMPEAMNRRANYQQFLALGSSLYRQLLAPVNLPTGRIIVSPDGSFVPFETLSRNAGAPDYLVKDYAFSYVYSVRLLLKKRVDNRSEIRVRGHDFLGIAPVNFAATLKQVALPGSEEALERTANGFHSPTLLTHDNATRRAFLKEATDASVIQLFTHATADSSGQEPQLYFADSTLMLSDLGDGDLSNTRLVVLAACKTGVGANQRGEGVFSLARGFAALGVPSVLTTLWSVQNEATYKLTELFYKYIHQGLPKDIALQRAKQEWLSEVDQTNQLPNFWAGLIIVGDTEPLPRSNYSLWMVLPLLALAGSGVWFWRKRKSKG